MMIQKNTNKPFSCRSLLQNFKTIVMRSERISNNIFFYRNFYTTKKQPEKYSITLGRQKELMIIFLSPIFELAYFPQLTEMKNKWFGYFKKKFASEKK